MPRNEAKTLDGAGQLYLLENTKRPYVLEVRWKPRRRALKEARPDLDLVCLILNDQNVLTKSSDLLFWNNRKSFDRVDGNHVVELFEKRRPKKYTEFHFTHLRLLPQSLPADCRLVFALALDKGCTDVLSLSSLKEVTITLMSDPEGFESGDLGDPFNDITLVKEAEIHLNTAGLDKAKSMHLAELVMSGRDQWAFSSVLAASDGGAREFVSKFLPM